MSGAGSDPIDHQFQVVELTEEQMRRVPQPYRALLVAASFVTNEILCLTRLFILTTNSARLCGPGPMRALAVANLGFLNRTLASRAFEFFRLIDEFGKKDALSQSELSTKLRNEFATTLRPLRKLPIYKLVERMRNQLSHHYSWADFERFSDVTGYGKTAMWLGEMEGNTIYSFGEEITNIGLFADTANAEGLIGDWIDWSREAARSISIVNSAIAISIAEEYVPEMSMETHVASVARALFADVNRTTIPMLWYPFDGMDR